MSNILITGATGFVGSHLIEYILEEHPECKIFPMKRNRANMENVSHIKDKKVKWVEGDLTDYLSLKRLMEEVEPDKIFHLGAQSFVPTSWKAPKQTLDTNIIGTLNILEAIRSSNTDPIIQITGSSEEYGLVHPHEVPIKETNPLRPLSPYGVSKVATDMLGWQYHKSYGLKAIRSRAHNHEGPRRGGEFVTSTFAKQAVEVKLGIKKYIYHGNLEARRDFTHVKDMVHAYWLLLEKCDYGEVYNICSEECYSMGDVLRAALKHAGLSIKHGVIKPDPKRMRPSDVPILLGDCSKFKEATRWERKLTFDDIMRDLVKYWEEKLKHVSLE